MNVRKDAFQLGPTDDALLKVLDEVRTVGYRSQIFGERR